MRNLVEEVDFLTRCAIEEQAVEEAYDEIWDTGYEEAIADALRVCGDARMLFEDLEAAGLINPQDYPEFQAA